MGRKITNPKPPAKRRSPAMTNPEKFCAEELADDYCTKLINEHTGFPDSREHDAWVARPAFLAGASARAEYTAKVLGEVRDHLKRIAFQPLTEDFEYCYRKGLFINSPEAAEAREALRLLETLAEGDSLSPQKAREDD